MEVGYKQILNGSQEYVKHEKRDLMYKVAIFLISQPWADVSWAPSIAEGLGVLLLTWNQAFYRYGSFDFNKLEGFMNRYKEVLGRLREREIFSFDKSDEDAIKGLFNELLKGLSIKDKKDSIRQSPVAISKALHLLAPKFFPIWDDEIAKAYGCYWYAGSNSSAFDYLKFIRKIRELSENIVQSYIDENGGSRETAVEDICKKSSQNMPFTKSLLKIIDEYNYSKHSKHWI